MSNNSHAFSIPHDIAARLRQLFQMQEAYDVANPRPLEDLPVHDDGEPLGAYEEAMRCVMPSLVGRA